LHRFIWTRPGQIYNGGENLGRFFEEKAAKTSEAGAFVSEKFTRLKCIYALGLNQKPHATSSNTQALRKKLTQNE
jgi:hypothetical protein